MLLIRTRVAPSSIHGLGLFTVEPVRAGTPVWQFQTRFDHAFSPAEFAALPGPAREHVAWFAFVRPGDGAHVLSGDHACFMNHSSEPNTGALGTGGEPVVTVALRELPAGTELTCDYHAFDAVATAKLGGATPGSPLAGGVPPARGEPPTRCNSRLSDRPGQA